MSDNLKLNVESMDKNHDEYLELLSSIKSCKDDEFMPMFEKMIEHTKEHFKFEEDLMDKYSFASKQEHLDEHANMIGEMEYFYEKSKRIRAFGKSYIDDYAYEKFKRHILNIDSQLAMFLKDKDI